MRLNWQGDTSSDDQEMHDALDQWVAAMPAGIASVQVDGDVLRVETCDPGTDTPIALNNRGLDALQMPAARSQFMFDAVDQGHLDVDKAFEFGDCVVHAVTFDQFVAQDRPAFQKAYDECLVKAGG
jgi:hypothetical protein